MSHYILILIVIGFITLLSRITQESWIAPGTIYAGMWFLLLLFSLLMAPDFYRVHSGYTYIFLTIVANYLGTQLGYWHGYHLRKMNTSKSFIDLDKINFWESIKVAYLVSFAISLSIPILLIVFYVDILPSFSTLQDFAHLASVNRYSKDGINTPSYISYIRTFYWVSATLAGIGFRDLKFHKGKILWFLWLIPMVLEVLIQTTRAQVLLGTCFFISGLFSSLRINHSEKKFKIQHFLIPFFLLYLAFWGLTFSYLYRTGDMNERLYEISRTRTYTYLFGSFSAFSIWYDEYVNLMMNNDILLGVMTFTGIPNALGIIDRQIGIYDKFIEINLKNSNTNVYTAFRPLIEDFGVMGSISFMSVLGFFGGVSWFKLNHSLTTFSLSVVIIYFTYVLYIPITSPFAYSSVILGVVVMTLIIFVALSINLIYFLKR